jgi:hypothetical protein
VESLWAKFPAELPAQERAPFELPDPGTRAISVEALSARHFRRLQFPKRAAEIFRQVGREKRLFARASIENTISAARPQTHAPCAASKALIFARSMRRNAREHISHSTGCHPRIAGGVVTVGMAAFADDCSTAFQQERDRIFFAEALGQLSARRPSPGRVASFHPGVA